jgi:hypothetical protein
MNDETFQQYVSLIKLYIINLKEDIIRLNLQMDQIERKFKDSYY